MTLRVAVALALVCLTVPAAARADADPASDFLISRSIFIPYGANADTDSVKRLDEAVQEAAARGFKIRVALIAQPSDLGGIFQLFRKPQRYAQFLGQELVYVYPGRLLVAMPNGFGFAHGGARDRRLERALVGLKAPGSDPDDLADGAATAVRRLAASAGHPLPPPSSSGDSQTRDRVTIVVAGVILLVLIGGFLFLRRLRRQRGAHA